MSNLRKSLGIVLGLAALALSALWVQSGTSSGREKELGTRNDPRSTQASRLDASGHRGKAVDSDKSGARAEQPLPGDGGRIRFVWEIDEATRPGIEHIRRHWDQFEASNPTEEERSAVIEILFDMQENAGLLGSDMHESYSGGNVKDHRAGSAELSRMPDDVLARARKVLRDEQFQAFGRRMLPGLVRQYASVKPLRKE